MASELTSSPSAESSQQSISLGQHTVLVARTADGGSVKLLSPGGEESIRIEVTAAGASIVLARDLNISVTGSLTFDADRVAIHGKSGLSLTTYGTVEVDAKQALDVRAHSASIEATRGDVKLQANDDVVMLGERILVNC